MEGINLSNLFLLPPETQCDILSNIKDVRTLQRIIVSTNNQGLNPLYDIAKDCVVKINEGLHIIEYESDDGTEIIRSDTGRVYVPILNAYPNVYKVKSEREGAITSVHVANISDIFFLSIHPSLRIAMVLFNFDGKDAYAMMKGFIGNYLYGYDMVNGKRKVVENNFKDKYLMLYLEDLIQKYVFICNDSLVVYDMSYENTLQLLQIINVLLETGEFKNLYLAIDWEFLKENTFTNFDHESTIEEFYTNLNSLNNPINIVNTIDIDYGYLGSNIDKINIINDKDQDNIVEWLSDTMAVDEIGGFEELSGPFNVDDALNLFTFDDDKILPQPISLGFVLYSSGDDGKNDINKIMNSKMHKNVKTLTMYVEDKSLFGQVIEKNGRTFIFKPHVNINFNRNDIFNINTTNM